MAGKKNIREYDDSGMEEGIVSDEKTQTYASDIDAVRIYFNNLKKYRLLSAKEETQLANRIAKGDSLARKRMIEANLRLVINIAKHYINRGLPFQDLIEEGNIGLIKAAEKFRPNKGCRFSTYATYWIKQAIERGLINQSKIVRLPIHVTSDLYRMMKVTRELTGKLNREPSVAEVSSGMGMSGRYVKRLSMMARKNVSLETGFGDDQEQTLLDRIEDDRFQTPLEMLEEDNRNEHIVHLMGMLDEKERAIIAMRFGLNHDAPQTLESIGARFGVTRERIRQIEARAVSKVRKILKREKIDSTDI